MDDPNDKWDGMPPTPGEILFGVGVALGIHAVAFLLCLLWWLSLNDLSTTGEAPLWVVVICTTFCGASAVQCIRVGIVFFTLLDDWRKKRRT